MKKLFILTSVLALAAFSSMAQGVILGNDLGTGSYIYIQDTTGVIDGGVAVKVGTPATAAGFVGAGPNSVAVSLYGAAQGTALSTLESAQSLQATGFNSTSSATGAQGTVSFGNVTTTLPVGSPAEFILYASVSVNGTLYSAWSGEATNFSPASNTGTPVSIFGAAASGLIPTFTLVPAPEPSTIALGGLGAAALLLFRRRK